jgi:hypothetical protein
MTLRDFLFKSYSFKVDSIPSYLGVFYFQVHHLVFTLTGPTVRHVTFCGTGIVLWMCLFIQTDVTIGTQRCLKSLLLHGEFKQNRIPVLTRSPTAAPGLSLPELFKLNAKSRLQSLQHLSKATFGGEDTQLKTEVCSIAIAGYLAASEWLVYTLLAHYRANGTHVQSV